MPGRVFVLHDTTTVKAVDESHKTQQAGLFGRFGAQAEQMHMRKLRSVAKSERRSSAVQNSWHNSMIGSARPESAGDWARADMTREMSVKGEPSSGHPTGDLTQTPGNHRRHSGGAAPSPSPHSSHSNSDSQLAHRDELTQPPSMARTVFCFHVHPMSHGFNYLVVPRVSAPRLQRSPIPSTFCGFLPRCRDR